MTASNILKLIEELKDEKVFARNQKIGVGENQFGAKLGAIKKLAKKVKVNHGLALELWDTKNHDAQLMATLIIKPNELSIEEMDRLVKSIVSSQVSDWFNAYVVKSYTNHEALRILWLDSQDPMAARAGWSLTAGRVARDPNGLHISALLDLLEAEMALVDPLVQWTMNSTLVQIGINFPDKREQAIAIAEKLGIYRDYPVSKGCTSPFAPLWIKEMISRQ